MLRTTEEGRGMLINSLLSWGKMEGIVVTAFGGNYLYQLSQLQLTDSVLSLLEGSYYFAYKSNRHYCNQFIQE